jgi:integrase/recombinase XerC
MESEMTNNPTEITPARVEPDKLPQLIQGTATPEVLGRVERFYFSVAEAFEAWVTRRTSPHTQRAYRQDMMSFVAFMGITWPENSWELLRATVKDVQAWRDELIADGRAPKTLNRRVSSLSGFSKYLGAAAADLRLPIVVPNPAHAQFIARESTDPVDETRALTVARARQLMAMPGGAGEAEDQLLAARDRAIVAFYLYSGARLATGCRIKIEDFHHEGDQEATIRINEKGKRRRTIGLHFAAASAIKTYLEAAGIESGPLFRPRLNPKSTKLADRHFSPVSMYRLITAYLERLPGAMKAFELGDGESEHRCIFTPHSLRATTATLLLDAGVDIVKVKELLGHRHVTTTQIYDKRRRTASESASHDVPI